MAIFFEKGFKFGFSDVRGVVLVHVIGALTLQDLVSMRVVPASRLGVTEALVRLVDLLKLSGGVLVFVFVWMPLEGHFLVALVDLFFGGLLLAAEEFVVARL